MNKVVIVAGAAVVLGVAYLLLRTKPATPADVDLAVTRALVQERDPNVLRTFAKKLDAAGRTTQALELMARVDALTKPFTLNVAQAIQAPIQMSQGTMSLAQVALAH